MAICIGHFGLTLLEARRCTPVDFQLYTLAYEIKREEQVHLQAIQAWFNQSVQAVEEKGNKKNPQYVSKFKTFEDFYDSQTMFNRLFNPDFKPKKSKKITMADINRKINNREEIKTDG